MQGARLVTREKRNKVLSLALNFCCSIAKSCPTLCDPMDYRMPGFPVLHWPPEFAQIHVHCVSNAIQSCHPLLPPSPFAFSLSQHRGLFPKSWLFPSGEPKFWSFTFRISPSNEYSGLISFRIDWFDLLAVQGTLKSLLQHHNLKVSILSDQISHSVVSDSLRPHESQYAKPPCPSPTPRVHSDSRPSSQ